MDNHKETGYQRLLTHSFPRPKKGENISATLARAIRILSSIRDIGLVLAPEILEWNLEKLTPGSQPLRLLQRRLCLTEISPFELTDHSAVFGPLALSFNTEKIRAAGALPVIYIPQGVSTPLSLIGLFCVNGAHHTKGLLGGLQEFKELTDPEWTERTYGKPLAEDPTFTLQNTNEAGQVVASYTISGIQIWQFLQHIGFNSIPFDHSIGVLGILLNIFCPTDNPRRSESLGYYKQREWRLIGNDIRFNGRPLGRELTAEEKLRITAVDPEFWSGSLSVDGVLIERRDLAVIYEPIEDWDPLSLIDSIYAPPEAVEQVKTIIGNTIPVHSITASGNR